MESNSLYHYFYPCSINFKYLFLLEPFIDSITYLEFSTKKPQKPSKDPTQNTYYFSTLDSSLQNFISPQQILILMSEEQRAKQLINNQTGLHCCQFVSYCIYGNINNNQGGANGWKNWGSAATQNDARVIWQDGHVGNVCNGKVYYSQGKGGQHKVKSLADYIKYVVNGKEYKFRK